jgi:hypothetical protein
MDCVRCGDAAEIRQNQPKKTMIKQNINLAEQYPENKNFTHKTIQNEVVAHLLQRR